MNPFTTVQRLLTFPAHAAAAVAGTSAGLLATGVRRVSHLVGRTAGHVADTAAPSGPWPAEQAPPVEVPPAPVETSVETPVETPVDEEPTPEPRVAPSAQAAVLAPALGLSEAEVEELTGDADETAPDARRPEEG